VTDSTFRGIAEHRSQAYWALSRFFLTRPDEAFVDEIRGGSAAGGADRGMPAVLRLKTALGESAPGPLAERLAREYTRLLRGLGEQFGLAPPYESLHRGGRLMDRTSQVVAARMRSAGFADVAPEAGPPDHIGTELRFMALLCLSEAQAWTAQDAVAAAGRRQEQAAFLEAHLVAWVPAYCRLLADAATEPFYSAVGELTVQMLHEDRQLLGALVDEFTVGDSVPESAGAASASTRGGIRG